MSRLRSWRARIGRSLGRAGEDLLAGPIRGELLGPDQLAERAHAIAQKQKLDPHRSARWGAPLLARLGQTRRILEDARERLTTATATGSDIGPAGEWFLDNYYTLVEHIGEVNDSLPRGYYRELPELAVGPLAGYPRVYELAITLISHSEGRIDLANASGFVAAFQQVAVLTLGELWALPAMLRLGLIENVRRMALRTVQRLADIDAADRAAASIARAGDAGQLDLDRVLEQFVAGHRAFTPAFVSRFLNQLRLQSGTPAGVARLDRWIADEVMSAQEATARTTERLALTQVMIANSITSLRAVGQMDWRTFVEEHSRVEAVLRTDPSGFYARMMFDTRDRYRHVVERIARRTRRSEELVARLAIDCAIAGQADSTDDPAPAHVGYYLVDDGLDRLEARAGYRPSPGELVERWVRRHASLVFGGAIIVFTVAALATLFWIAGSAGRQAWLLLALPGLFLANDIAITVVNQLISAVLPPRILPKLDLRRPGVPEEHRTAVVIPTLFADVEGVRDALDNLEVQFLANRQSNLHYAVLSDFTDSATETCADDDAIVEAALEGVRSLNARYAPATRDAFYLFHRPRRWNPNEGVWMGWERKRGKLAEFNRFVLDGSTAPFQVLEGDAAVIRKVRYVITLDADTSLPPDGATALVGALAHPLNRAYYDTERGRVTRGYGILQPRVGISLPSAHRSRFATIHSGQPGVDPYTTAVSDVYQDLFGEGSFTGKGIYDVAVFERATHGRFPDNTLLSHDLIEGSFARAGLATDIIVYDDYPGRYLSNSRRKHRWIRGDWQLLPWLAPRVAGPNGDEPNRLSWLSRWKIFDNLRRSAVEVAQFVFFGLGWLLLPGDPLRWTALGVGAVAAPWILAVALDALRPPVDRTWRAYYAALARDAAAGVLQVGLALVFLVHQAWVSIDAIVRTLWRMGVTRRHQLEWQTASQVERTTAESGRMVWRAMVGAPLLATVVVLLAVLRFEWAGVGTGTPPWHVVVAILPLALAWFVSPHVAHALSRPVLRDRRLSSGDRERAARYALLHWRFFDRFVGEETHWLAPDNFQSDPEPVVAMRTSPTNIGLQLLGIMTAWDLGFVTLEDMTRRLERTFGSLARLRRFRGHFHNWYDLGDLHVLEPAYISTVDSGNLAGHLLALRQGCLVAADAGTGDVRATTALLSAIGLAEERVQGLRMQSVAIGGLHEARSILTATGHRPGAGSLLEAALPPLERAKAALEAAIHDETARASGVEWIEWCIRRIGEEEAWAQTIGAGRGDTLRDRAADGAPEAARLVRRLDALAERAYELAMSMDFGFLFDRDRSVFAIGYQRASRQLDGSHYDLLASEARLTSFVAIAKNDVPVEHWFRLGRMLTQAAGVPALVSWSGSMFEYLMPALIMRDFPSTLLEQSSRAAVVRQRSYGTERGVPWGNSESAYNVRDHQATYQYRAFGVPDLALKRGLGRDLVVAPYASALAALVDPRQAFENLERLEALGALGPYGFRDAIDYTRSAPGARFALVHTWMAHHVGMSLVAFDNVLDNDIWQRRFQADPLVRSVELLLHEQVPRRRVMRAPSRPEDDEGVSAAVQDRPAVREFDDPDTIQPHVALLGHLPYTVMVTHCGSGYSRFESLAVTRWRADGCRDATGQYCYLKDIASGRVWSSGHQPVCAPADSQRATLAIDRVTLVRVDGDLHTRTEIVAVPEDAAEVRRVTVTNAGSDSREIELTSYGELVLAPPDDDRAHPAFGNLFVETEWHEWCNAITASRRPRASHEKRIWCVHVVAAGPECVGAITCETDRARFLGRGRSTRDPVALEQDGALSMTTGAVLDPIFALRTRIRLQPGQSASVAFTTLIATSRERAFELADRYRGPHAAQRALDIASTSSQAELREIDVSAALAAVFQELAGEVLHGDLTATRATTAELRSTGSQPVLWTTGISGDIPIVLATIGSTDGLVALRQLISAHRYWSLRGMRVDLVILDNQPSDYLSELADRITASIHELCDADATDRPGGVHLRRRDLLTGEQTRTLRAFARVCIDCDGRPLGRIMAARAQSAESGNDEVQSALPIDTHDADNGGDRVETVVRRLGARLLAPLAALGSGAAAAWSRKNAGETDETPPNGFGVLSDDGDYVIHVSGDRLPPAPWANVIANPHGGCFVTERGGGCTWAGSSYFFRLTPWHNDPVSDPVSDVVYLQDEATGSLWSATPGPVRANVEYRVRHGAGWSSFTCERNGVASELMLGMADDAAVKISSLRLTNTGRQHRRVVLTTFVEWNLGVLREHDQYRVRTQFDPVRQVLFARNPFDPAFAGWMAFHCISAPVSSHTASRYEFLGRNGTASYPEALGAGGRMTGATGAGIDPCGALQTRIELAAGETRDVAILLGAADSEAAARALARRYGGTADAFAALDRSVAAWRRRLSVVRVRTPEPEFDAMINRWAPYQALSCRMWARTALYQSSGAYGFRDQLQDSVAFVYMDAGLTREHLLRAAARQFVEGDVQHWWHPHDGRGVRTRCSDDLVWLPWAVDHYVRVTGDASVLDELVPFLRMRTLSADEHEIYEQPEVTEERASLYDHCLRALRRACTSGPHRIPLIGTGDWNDGMNRVGIEGRGESIWLAWFLASTLRSFAALADARGDGAVADELGRLAADYVVAVEAQGWDGEWYRRAYYDDGTPLGSAQSAECRIDAIAQSWSVISGAAQPERQRQAMRSLEAHLVDESNRIVRLLTPPFDKTTHDPGYIKGYLPGIRENGAQYTHAALWTVLATAMLGDGDRAFERFQMLNPLTHARTPADVATYRVEPYAVAADVYTAAGHLGRGGWTWYTGSASWMFRVGLEWILGLRKRGDRLFIEPCTPTAWKEYVIEYRYGRSLYVITVRNESSSRWKSTEVTMDGVVQHSGAIPLVDDGGRHEVEVRPLPA